MFVEPIRLKDAPIGARVRWQQGDDILEVEVLDHYAIGEETWQSSNGRTIHIPAKGYETLVRLPAPQYGPIKHDSYGETDWDVWNSDAEVTLLG